jgi:hypothetical protein
MLIDVIFDESWSVRGGNDIVGLRHELILIALEHVCGVMQLKGKWYARISTFDMPSVFDMPTTRLTWRGPNLAQNVLLPALHLVVAPSSGHRYGGPRTAPPRSRTVTGSS